MKLETTKTEARPFIYVTHTVPMTPAAIAGVMERAFRTLGAFVGRNAVVPSGPPLALYRDFTREGVTVDVGFPVDKSSLAKAGGEVKAGETPSGTALKAIHRGPYDTLRSTYEAVDGELRKTGRSVPPRMWEVYISDPEKTPPADLLTEIYFPIP